MLMTEIIEKKKTKQKLTNEEIKFFIDGYVNGSIPDYQASALLMAIYLNDMDDEEITNLTEAMLHSGETMDLSEIEGICVDKHSTGGVGDKTSLVVGPIVASIGLKLAKMSGRGLGHTGGTLDKLESIPGMSIAIDREHFIKQVKEIGIAIIGQTNNVCPADKKLYALRDVTATVGSIPLISSSIMSKKLASGAKTIVLDVKVGEGSFMKTIDQATLLAQKLVTIGNNAKDFKRHVIACLTDMDEPLGENVGNSLEVIEAIETLKGHGPKRFVELCTQASKELLVESGFIKTEEEALRKIEEVIRNGKALEKFKEMIIYQGGNPAVIDDYTLFPQASFIYDIEAKSSGYVEKVDALQIGLAAMALGAGRKCKEDDVDLGVGLKILKNVGDKVNKGEAIVRVFSNHKGDEEAKDLIEQAYYYSFDPVSPRPVILGLVK